MKKNLVFVIVTSALLLGFFFFNNSRTETIPVSTPVPTPIQNEPVDIKASFTIITGNITRSFKAEKYHNQSPDVFIQSDNPSIIHIKSAGVTYDDFFKTLPMKLTSECLITGDGETLCNGKGSTLKFYLNDIETPNLLEKEVRDEDKILIKFIY